jgi:hypothetical protein
MGLGHFPADPETENASTYQENGTVPLMMVAKFWGIDTNANSNEQREQSCQLQQASSSLLSLLVLLYRYL